MRLIKGFVTIDSMTNNDPGQVAPLGELSTMSLTYAKEKREYTHFSFSDYRFICFKGIDVDSKEITEITQEDCHSIFKVVLHSIQYALGHIRPYNAQDFRNTLIADIATDAIELDFGRFKDNGNFALPEWISFKSADGKTFYKYWLADSAFSDQYDEFEIEVIPPVNDVDIFFSPYATVVQELAKRTLSDLSRIIEEAKGQYPETYVKFNNYLFYNVNNRNQKVDTNWTLLIYGKGGNDVDVMKDAVIDYVLKHSRHSREQWQLMFPELFKRTEFALVPRWDKLAIEDMQAFSGLYAAMLSPNEMIDFTESALTFYPAPHIRETILTFPFDFKNLMISVVPGTSNSEASSTLVSIFPDYLAINSSSLDFNRMSVATRHWAILLEEMLILAETADEFTTLPYHIRRSVKGNDMFLSSVYNNVNYLVMCKKNGIFQ